MSEVPGTVSFVQLAAVDQLLSPPPPSQVTVEVAKLQLVLFPPFVQPLQEIAVTFELLLSITVRY